MGQKGRKRRYLPPSTSHINKENEKNSWSRVEGGRSAPPAPLKVLISNWIVNQKYIIIFNIYIFV